MPGILKMTNKNKTKNSSDDNIDPAPVGRENARLRRTVCLLSLPIYGLLFIYLFEKVGSGMAITAIIPVIIFAWFYGSYIGILAGAATMPANFVMALIAGIPWWEKVFMRSAGIFGTICCMGLGLLVGYMRDLAMKTNREIADRKNAEARIRSQQDRLNEQARELELKNQTLETEIAKTEQVVNEADKTKKQLESFISISLDPIILADEKGNIVNPNPAFLNMIRYSREEVMGKPIYRYVVSQAGVYPSTTGETVELGKDYLDQKKVEIALFLKAGKISDREIYFQRKDKKLVPVNQSIVMLKNEKGRGSDILSITRDITDQKKTELALTKARKNAEEANLSKSTFLANMSHEIRTPMNGVIGFTDMLVDTGLNAEQLECAQTIKRSGEALLSLINDILDFSKIEAGKIELEALDFDVEVLAYDVCELMSERIDKKKVAILCRIDDSLPSRIKGDPHRFRQVLLNLMGNAVKFTRKGEIILSLMVAEEQENRIKLHVMIRDTGVGIPADKQDTIFDLFHQADNSTTRKYGGAGLGLSICKRIAIIMNGDVWVESVPNQGSTFHFTAWLGKAETKTVPRVAPGSLHGKRVLIADDNATNREILTHVAAVAGMEVHSCSNGEETLAAVAEADKSGKPFDVCVFDIMMPGISGYTVAKRIRKIYGEGLPMLAFSSSVEWGMEKCVQAGYNGFLPKPINRIKLYKMLERLIGKSEAVKKSSATETEKKIVTQYSLREDAKYSISLLLAEDNPVNQKLATKLLTKAGYRVEVVNNGQEAIAVYQANPENFDIILMDIQMPQMNGLDATRAIRENGFQKVPIIAMTANAMEGDRRKCLDSGMNDYITKPIKRETIFRILRKWVFEKV